MRWLSCGALLWIAGVFALASPDPAHAAGPTMFDEGRAQAAFAAIQEAAGLKLRVLTLTIRPDELAAEVANPSAPGTVDTWIYARTGLLGHLGYFTASRQGTARARVINGTLEDNLIDIDASGLAMVPRLATAAISRARLQSPGSITEMELHRVPNILTGGVLPPGWDVHVEGIEEEADIYAKITGEITIANLDNTKRHKNLNLLAGGADFDEMIGSIRSEIGDKWTFQRLEIEQKAINFDVTLNSIKNPRVTRFTATLSRIETSNFSMPHMVFPGEPADDPFSLDDVDFGLLPKLADAAKAKLQIDDGLVDRAVLSKPHRERGEAIEWEVHVRPRVVPLFVMPDRPKPPEGSVFFDTNGNALRTKWPEGYGPRVNLFDAEQLAKAIAKIGARLGEHVQVIEVMVRDTVVDITAQDPQDPGRVVVFRYRDEDVSRASYIEQRVANMTRANRLAPDWFWDLALLQPAVLESIPALETQTLSRLNIIHGTIDRITISKDKVFHPANDQVLIEIRASGDGRNSDYVMFDLSGTIANPPTLPSEIFVGRPGTDGAGQSAEGPTSAATRQDGYDCQGSDTNKQIPACTRLVADQTLTPHQRAVAYYNRGNAYYDRGSASGNSEDWDRAIADYSEAIRLDPQYLSAYRNRGLTYAFKGDGNDALPDLNRVIEVEPPSAGAYFDRGWAYLLKGDFAHAIADYDAALKLRPGYAAAYQDRCEAYVRQADLDQAIADCSEAIRIEPQRMKAYTNRGWAYRLKGDFDKAIADDAAAIQLRRNSAIPYFQRGFAQYLAGALPKALADLTQANAIGPAEPYTVLLLDIVDRRSNLPSRLEQLSTKVDMRVWPAPVIRFYLGQLTPEALLAAADDPDPAVKQGRLCEANFYTGELDLIRGNKDDAIRLFTTASGDCPFTWTEREAARAELRALGAASPAQATH